MAAAGDAKRKDISGFPSHIHNTFIGSKDFRALRKNLTEPPVLLGFCRRSFPDAATSVCAAIALEPMVIWVSRGSGPLRGGPEEDNQESLCALLSVKGRG